MVPDLDTPVHREIRDGVPVFWTPQAPRVVGALMFRSGYADESITTRGVGHFVEHLALFGCGRKATHEINGFVDGIRTVFWASGTVDEVSDFMQKVCTSLTDLPLHRLEAESRVLRTEAAGRQPGVVEKLLWWRFGTRGHGLAFFPEYLLEAPNRDLIHKWCTERYTAENATMWLSAPPPDGLRFDMLPHGRRMPSDDPKPVADLKTPTFLRERPGGVGMSFVSDRDDWISIPWGVASERLMSRLRFDAGVAYSVQFVFQHLSSHQSHSTIWSSCLEDQALAVQEGMLVVLEELSRSGPTLDELAQVREHWIKLATQPENIVENLDSVALNELVGFPIRSHRELLEEYDRRTAGDWAESVARALQSTILLLPPTCSPLRSDLTPLPGWSSWTVSGRKYRAAVQRFPWSKKQPALVVGRQGVSLVTPEGRAITVGFETCAGAVVDGKGTIQLFDENGFMITIAPHEWHGGGHAAEEVLRSVPPGRLLGPSAR